MFIRIEKQKLIEDIWSEDFMQPCSLQFQLILIVARWWTMEWNSRYGIWAEKKSKEKEKQQESKHLVQLSKVASLLLKKKNRSRYCLHFRLIWRHFCFMIHHRGQRINVHKKNVNLNNWIQNQSEKMCIAILLLFLLRIVLYFCLIGDVKAFHARSRLVSIILLSLLF